MHRYKITYYVNSMPSETIISANTSLDAEKILRAQYPGANISMVIVTPL